MKLYSTPEGIARGASDRQLEFLELGVADLGALLDIDPTLDRIKNADVRMRRPLAEVQLYAPVPRPGSVYCVGANFESHVAEVQTVLTSLGDEESMRATLAKLRHTPMFFSVPASSVAGPNDPIILPTLAPTQVDYEIEVAVIIGAGGKNIPVTEAMDHVAGLTLANDVSARDIQAQAMRGQEFEYGHAKGLDSFKPMGPCLVTMDEFSVPIDIDMEAMVNDEVRQSASLSDLIHDIPKCVSYISTFHTLRPGDAILTGSPSGVGYFQGKFLRVGDVVKLTAQHIGELKNEVVVES